MKKRNQINNRLWNHFWDQFRYQVDEQTWDTINTQLWDSLYWELGRNLQQNSLHYIQKGNHL